jgi:hypothetical protein
MNMTDKQRNEFYESNCGLIGKVAKHYTDIAKKYGYTYKDLYNCGVIGMFEGIDTYDVDQATNDEGEVVPLEAWVNYGIKKHISKFAAKWRKHDQLANKVSMQQVVSSGTANGTGTSLTVEDMLSEEEHTENYGMGIDKERVMELVNSGLLRDVEKIAVYGRFIEGIKFDDLDVMVQKHLGNPKARAFHYINTAMKKLREALAV